MDRQPTDARRRTYAEWYVWARRNLTNNAEICHACAEAATEAAGSGGDSAAAARAAAQSRSGAGWTSRADPAVRSYAEWYDWARTTLALTGEPLHSAAAAALQALDRGEDATAAAEAARQSAAGSPPSTAWVPAESSASAPAAPAPPAPTPPEPAPPPPPFPHPAQQQAPVPPPPPPPNYGVTAPPLTYADAPAFTYPGAAPPHPAGPVILPVWVAILLGIGCGISLLIGLVFVAVIFTPNDQQTVTGALVLSVLFGLIFATSVLALIGIVTRTGWARAMAIVAGVAFCLSCAGIVFGLPVIIGSATARRGQ